MDGEEFPRVPFSGKDVISLFILHQTIVSILVKTTFLEMEYLKLSVKEAVI